MNCRRASGIQTIEAILEKTMEVLGSSKAEMYDIIEDARGEYNRVCLAIEELKREIAVWIKEVDRLEIAFHRARLRLFEVSRNFQDFTEEYKRLAYEEADQLREQLTIAREEEKHLRQRRDEQEQSLVRIERIVERGDRLLSQMNVAIEFLSGNLAEITHQLEDMQTKFQIGQKIIRIHEEERRRVAREIHDGPAQDLANVVLKAEICERMYKADRTAEAMVELSELKGQVRQSLQEVRKIIYNLRPMALDDLGLVPALKRFFENTESEGDTVTELLVLGQEARVDPAVEVAVFRTVQEAVNNSRKHSQATRIIARVEFRHDRINVAVDDNGIGFDEETVRRKLAAGKHFGLFGMRERVELLGGTILTRSKQGQGTKVMVSIPLEEPKGGVR